MSRLRVSATALVVVALLLLASSSPADAAQKKKGKGKKSSSRKSGAKKRGAISTRAALVQGDATWYDGINNGFCGFGGNLPADRFIVVSLLWVFLKERDRRRPTLNS